MMYKPNSVSFLQDQKFQFCKNNFLKLLRNSEVDDKVDRTVDGKEEMTEEN